MVHSGMFILVTAVFYLRCTQGFTATITNRVTSRIILHAVPPPYNPTGTGGLASSTSNLKPGRNYAPTNPGVKHASSREEGYLANLNRSSRGDTPSYSSTTSSGVPGGYTPYQSIASTASPPQTKPSPVVTTLLTADGVGGRQTSSIYSRSDNFDFLGAPGAKEPPQASSTIATERMTNTPIKGRVYIKGDGHDRSDASAAVYINPSHERVPVAATTAPVHVRNALRDGYDSQLVPRWKRTNSFAPTQSSVKFVAASSGSSYLDSLATSQPAVYRPPIVSRMDDPFATSKKAAHAVSGLLQCDPRSGESFSSDPFAASKRAADAVSLLLIKYTDPKDVLFYLA